MKISTVPKTSIQGMVDSVATAAKNTALVCIISSACVLATASISKAGVISDFFSGVTDTVHGVANVGGAVWDRGVVPVTTTTVDITKSIAKKFERSPEEVAAEKAKKAQEAQKATEEQKLQEEIAQTQAKLEALKTKQSSRAI